MMTPSTLLFLVLAIPPLGKHPQPGESTVSVPKSSAEAHERARELLNSIDRPVKDADWQALGASVVPYLESIADDTKQLSPRRGRALAGLAVLAPDEAKTRAHALSRDEKAPFMIRNTAIATLAKVTPAEELQTELTPVLTGATRIELRAHAAEVLTLSSPSTCGAVKTQASKEPANRLNLYKASLKTCEK